MKRLMDSLFPDGVASPTFVPPQELAEVLTPRLGIDAIESYLLGDDPVTSQRTVAGVASGDMLLMPAESAQWVGVKLATVAPHNPAVSLPRIQGTYHLFDAATLTPRASFDATMLTALRTPAVSAVAADRLARPRAIDLVVFGTSVQAAAHIACLAEIRHLNSVTVVGRSLERAAMLADRLDYPKVTAFQSDGGAPLARALRKATVVVTCTSSSTPVFNGLMLGEDRLVIAIGSHSPYAREIDGDTLRDSYLVVENHAAAWREYGDLIIARDEGAIGANAISCDLRQLVRANPEVDGGLSHVPDKPVFKSAGMGWEDLAVAAAAAKALSITP
ncbi:MAG: hypothetical protein LBH48_01155 [Bifidobacteriaceae bacterium]|jgi:ornithine cyclodeaminase|nr:hypothetical protein [Bifidobacteriaceae bacterium]